MESLGGRGTGSRLSVEGGQSTQRTHHPKLQDLRITDSPEEDNLEESDEDFDLPVESEAQPEMNLQQQMEDEKHSFPGAATWAKEEERLFELLFTRQDLPILPAHWAVDFSNVPVRESNYCWQKEEPLIYAHGKEFLATMAFLRLIDLTTAVRTLAQSGLRKKGPQTIKKGLDQYLSWATEDGGYDNRKVVPNIVNELVDPSLPGSEVIGYIKKRMRALARLQREFLRVDRDPDFWVPRMTRYPGDEESPMRKKLLLQKYLSPRAKRNWPRARRSIDELASDSYNETPSKGGAGTRRKRTFSSPHSGEDELANARESLSGTMITPPKVGENVKNPFLTPQRNGTFELHGVKYRHRPPVVYGFFVYVTSVFVVTVDSSKGDDGYVSFQVETDMMDRRQSVWNALTLGMVTCMARDELRSRLLDFQESNEGAESDPDV